MSNQTRNRRPTAEAPHMLVEETWKAMQSVVTRHGLATMPPSPLGLPLQRLPDPTRHKNCMHFDEPVTHAHACMYVRMRAHVYVV